MKAIEIHGKKYYPVAERVKQFRKDHPEYGVQTNVVNISDDSVLMRAVVTNDVGNIISTGHAFERLDWGKINTRSMVENCETSAVGRALGFLGIGIEDDIASADEMAGVDNSGELSYEQQSLIESLIQKATIPEAHVKRIMAELATMTAKRATQCIKYLKENQANDSIKSTADIDREMKKHGV